MAKFTQLEGEHQGKEKAIKEYNYKKSSSSKVRQKKGRKEKWNCKSNRK